MEGLVKTVTYGAIAVGCAGIWTEGRWSLYIGGVVCAGICAVELYSLYHGGVRYKLETRQIEFTNPKDASHNWSKRFIVFSILKGPGKDNVDESLQELCNFEGSDTTAYCKGCGAHQNEMVFRQ
jgi:hypothetical protein